MRERNQLREGWLVVVVPNGLGFGVTSVSARMRSRIAEVKASRWPPSSSS